jgi:hypothetical protein
MEALVLFRLIKNPELEDERLLPRCGRFNPAGERPGADCGGGWIGIVVSL